MPQCPIEKKTQRFGYRVGEIGESSASHVIDFEVKELGNDHILTDAAKVLKTKSSNSAVQKAINLCFGNDAQAVWLTKKKKRAEEMYGPGEVDKIIIPKGAVILSDLGDDGQLWVYKKQKLHYADE